MRLRRNYAVGFGGSGSGSTEIPTAIISGTGRCTVIHVKTRIGTGAGVITRTHVPTQQEQDWDEEIGPEILRWQGWLVSGTLVEYAASNVVITLATFK